MRVVITFDDGSLLVLLSRHSSRANKPSLCLMLEYKDLTSNVAKIALWRM